MDPSRVQLDVTSTPDGRAIVRLAGELSRPDAEGVRQILIAEARRCTLVAVDLAELSFIDLSGMRALGDAQLTAMACGSGLVLVSPHRHVPMLRRLLGLGHIRLSYDRSILESRSPRPGPSLTPSATPFAAE